MYVSAVCDVRLDFEQFTTNAPAKTDESDACQDILTVSTVKKTYRYKHNKINNMWFFFHLHRTRDKKFLKYVDPMLGNTVRTTLLSGHIC